MRAGPNPGPSPTPWYTIHLGVTTLSIGVLVGVRHELPHVPDRLEFTVLGVVIGMFTGTSVLHWYDANRTESATRFTKSRQ